MKKRDKSNIKNNTKKRLNGVFSEWWFLLPAIIFLAISVRYFIFDNIVGAILNLVISSLFFVIFIGFYVSKVKKFLKENKKLGIYDGFLLLGLIWFVIGLSFKNVVILSIGAIFLIIGVIGKLQRR